MEFYFHLPYRLDGNGITDEGAGMLADTLKVNQSLQNLRSVSDSSITPCISGVHTLSVLHLIDAWNSIFISPTVLMVTA